jgi:hypothetical protein
MGIKAIKNNIKFIFCLFASGLPDKSAGVSGAGFMGFHNSGVDGGVPGRL